MSTPPSLPNSPKPKLTWYEHVWVGWPIALVAVGGAISAACGGAAWAINQKVFHATKQPALRYLWTGLISVASIVNYLILAAFFMVLFQKSR